MGLAKTVAPSFMNSPDRLPRTAAVFSSKSEIVLIQAPQTQH